MNTAHVPSLEIESLEQWDTHIANATKLSGWVMQSIDLTEREADLEAVDPDGAVFLGCTIDPDLEEDLRDAGALIFPQLPIEVPFNAYRSTLYQPQDLYDAIYGGERYDATADARIYSWAKSRTDPVPLQSSLAMTLHDHSISDALEEALRGTDIDTTVGVMGGHKLQRDTDGYVGAARLGAMLGKAGFTVLTGGGPGAMEAANLGAYFANNMSELSGAIARLSTVPSFDGDPTGWIATALDIRAQFAPSYPSFGIPTWYYGHEPANVFATQIAKYFSNAVREDILLQHCHGGIVYLPGAAGTVQEIFQATTNNYYALERSQIAPMVFVGEQYWTETLPAWPLLSSLACDRMMEDDIALVDEVDDAVEWLKSRQLG